MDQGAAEPKSREVQIVAKVKAVLQAGPAGHGIWLVLEHAGPMHWPFVVQQPVDRSDASVRCAGLVGDVGEG